jgi:hypothetical protein
MNGKGKHAQRVELAEVLPGANLHWPREFGLHVGPSTGDHISYSRDIWIFGLINAAPFLVSAWLVVFLMSSNHLELGLIM